MKFIQHNQTIENATIGGKARNLFALKNLGLNVPNWVVIPQEVLEETIPKELQDINNDKIRDFIKDCQLPQKSINDIVACFSEGTCFAVRSSAIDEDGTAFSFAGQFESYLFVTKENLAESIKKVWLSAFSERVIQYRKKNHIVQKFGIAVIVQEMIDADVAGVAFGINPITGDRNEQVISGVFGLGEGLVSGELDADNFMIKNKNIVSKIVQKTHQIKPNAQKNGTEIIATSTSSQSVATLNDAQVFEVVTVLETCKKFYGKPQDIEFAFKDDILFVLQARPITNLHQVADPKGEHIIWDNSNIIESYPGVTTPLTFSFIIKMYEAVYVQFAEMMGVNAQDIAENQSTFANMLGLIKGRVYYNLLSWYKALALLPGYALNAGFMEKMMGVKERFELKDLKQRSKFSEQLRVLNMVRIMLKNLWALPTMRVSFQADFNAVMAEYDKIDFEKCRADELMHLYLRFEQTLLKKWKAPLVNDFFAMIYFGVLQKLVIKYNISDTTNIANDLLCGAKDIISTEPVHRCLNIATMIAEDEKAKHFFINSEEKIIWNSLQNGEFPSIKKEIDDYIKKFGERCVGELKLETITYKQQPTNFIKILKSYAEQGVTKSISDANIEEKLRKDAEEKVNKSLKNKFSQNMIFNHVLKNTRILVSARENLRYERTRGFGVVRQLFCAIGKVFFAESIIEQERDIFFLSKEEIFDHIKGTSFNADLKALITLRKVNFEAFENDTTGERIHTRGIVYQGNDFNPHFNRSILEGDLQGIGCCPGRVRAKVRIVKDPNEVENLNGDILVTSSTDPGWVTLFPTASAILVERGSLLSHSAIVSREMGKPCIVGISRLLQVLKTGDEVEMDGSTGVVRVIK
jgi:pyruvate,water dikinase